MSSGKRRRTETKEAQPEKRSERLGKPKRATRIVSLGALPQGTVRRIMQLNKTVGSPVPEAVVEAVGFCTEQFLHLLVKASMDQASAGKRKTIRPDDIMSAIQANSTQLKFLTDVFGPPL